MKAYVFNPHRVPVKTKPLDLNPQPKYFKTKDGKVIQLGR